MTNIQLGAVHVSGLTPREGYLIWKVACSSCPPRNNQAAEGNCSIVGCLQA